MKMVRSEKDAQRWRRQWRHRPMMVRTQPPCSSLKKAVVYHSFLREVCLRGAVVAGLQGDSELAAQHFHTAMW